MPFYAELWGQDKQMLSLGGRKVLRFEARQVREEGGRARNLVKMSRVLQSWISIGLVVLVIWITAKCDNLAIRGSGQSATGVTLRGGQCCEMSIHLHGANSSNQILPQE